MAATKSTKTTNNKKETTMSNDTTTTTVVEEFIVTDNAPVFKSRRPKSELRKALEALEVDKWLCTNLEHDPSNSARLSSTVQTVQKASGVKFSTRTSEDNILWVTRLS